MEETPGSRLSRGLYELWTGIYAQEIEQRLFEILNMKDYPVLYTAIREDVDVERPEMLIPAQFLDRYLGNGHRISDQIL